PEEEFKKLKEQSINNLQLQQENPSSVAENEVTTALFGDTPIGRYSTPESVATISLDDVKQFYQRIYKPNEAILIVSGDIDVPRGKELAQKLLAGWKAAESLPEVRINLPEMSSGRRIILVDRPEGKQATVRMVVRRVTLHSDD